MNERRQDREERRRGQQRRTQIVPPVLPSDRTMPVCNACGTFVTSRFARVFGDNEDNIHGCRDCLSVTALVDGHASRDTS